MNKLTKLVLTATTLLALSFSANAHDPKMHMKKAEKPNCAPLEKMQKEGNKMDMADPVMIAMMKKCKNQSMHPEDNENHSEKMDHENMDHENMDHEDKNKQVDGDEHNHNQ